jgi:hypothetical protein
MKLRNRIKGLRHVQASDLRPNPRNWRVHPEAQQNALRGVLAEVGIADALLARELPDGSLELVDGHLRADVDPEVEWPVLVLDVTAEEAALLLATVDPLANMAETDAEKLGELLEGTKTTSDAVQALLDSVGGVHDEGDGEVNLTQLDRNPPPKMTWALIGIPTTRFGEIAEIIEAVAAMPETIVETTCNDGD